MLRQRAEAVVWIRTQMAQYGLTVADLIAAGCFAQAEGERERELPRLAKARYGSASGQTWDGIGEMPDWLRRAVNAGQSIEHFRLGT
ncbi:H-NS histone family protein [Ralstonia sp. 21MJYT02-11]|uniref:H-NS histone family protein n=2 Tax=Ralstonia soli TaxID=2953896 RepID=A0ABT1AEB1_9RALS|nr:H-NS family nucleoid-associated regulatory protein [Ralstonia soli]MCO5396669.1 H-NS histone family protein [Ralstonia soli]